KYFWMTSAFKIKYPGVLQIPVYNTDAINRLFKPAAFGYSTTNTTNNQLYFYTKMSCFIQFVYKRIIYQAIELDDNFCIFFLFCISYFLVYQTQKSISHINRSYQQRFAFVQRFFILLRIL